MQAPRVKIGITGHQRLADPSGWGWIRSEIDRYLAQVERPIVGLTSLATGADQLFADAVLEVGGNLRVIVPFDGYESRFSSDEERAKYRGLLARAASVVVLPGTGEDEDGYYVAGKRIVDESDVLVAVWNGKPAKGLGGTADIVDYAGRIGKQVRHLVPDSCMVLLRDGDIFGSNGSVRVPGVEVLDVSRSVNAASLENLASALGRSEHHLVDLLAQVMRISTGGRVWLETELNIWDRFPDKRWPEATLKITGHVWQPDIDLLFGPEDGGRRHAPVHAVEVKYFANATGPAQVIPKTKLSNISSGSGYHEGLGQALALLLDGVDYVSLWQVFHLPFEAWVTYEDKFSESFSDRVQAAYTEFCSAYAGKIIGLIRALALPIGYQCLGLLTGRDRSSGPLGLRLIAVPTLRVEPPLNPVQGGRDPQRARQYLLKALGVQ